MFSPLLPLYPYTKLDLVSDLRGVAKHGRFTTNKWGMRGENPPGNWTNFLTIITVGGSATQCFYLDDATTWPALLQQRLRMRFPRTWIGNGGIDGHSTRGDLVFAAEILPQVRPKMVLYLVGMNDACLALEAEREKHGNFDEMSWWTDSPVVRLRQYSRLFDVLYMVKQVFLEGSKTVRGAHRNWEPVRLDHPTDTTNLCGNLNTQLTAYQVRVDELIRSTKASGAVPVFMTQPILFEDSGSWESLAANMPWLRSAKEDVSAAAVARLMNAYNKALRDECARQGVLCFDLVAHVPHDQALFYDACHFTESGAAVVAEEVERFLVESGRAALVPCANPSSEIGSSNSKKESF